MFSDSGWEHEAGVKVITTIEALAASLQAEPDSETRTPSRSLALRHSLGTASGTATSNSSLSVASTPSHCNGSDSKSEGTSMADSEPWQEPGTT